MKRQATRVFVGLLGIFAAILFSSPANAEHTRVTYPDSLNAEILGRGLLWSLTYDRVVSDDLAAGFGFGTVGTKTLGGVSQDNAQMVPVYMNYYLMREAGSVYVTAGTNVVLNSVTGLRAKLSNLEFNDTHIVPTFGIGYENRTEAGFLVRATAYGMVSANFAGWFGFTFGFAF